MKNVLSNLLIAFGVICIIYASLLFWQRNNPRHLNFSSYSLPQGGALSRTHKAVRLTIKVVGIDLPIIPARIKDNVWETTDHGVSYLVDSPAPGSFGNSVLYGHNWLNLMGPLTRSKVGQDVVVGYNDGTSQDFTIEYLATVTPNETHILDNSNDTRLTIYTCTGFLDSRRFVVVARAKNLSTINMSNAITLY